MKINKQITIDVEIMEKLRQEDNASALIERLLREHYALGADKKKNLMIQKQIMLQNYSKTAKKLKKELKILKQIEEFGIDNIAIRWLRSRDLRPSTFEIINYVRGREIKVKIENFFKAFDIIKEHGDIFEKI